MSTLPDGSFPYNKHHKTGMMVPNNDYQPYAMGEGDVSEAELEAIMATARVMQQSRAAEEFRKSHVYENKASRSPEAIEFPVLDQFLFPATFRQLKEKVREIHDPGHPVNKCCYGKEGSHE